MTRMLPLNSTQVYRRDKDDLGDASIKQNVACVVRECLRVKRSHNSILWDATHGWYPSYLLPLGKRAG